MKSIDLIFVEKLILIFFMRKY